MDTYYINLAVEAGATCHDHPDQLLKVLFVGDGEHDRPCGLYCPVCDDQEADHEAAENGELPYAWLEEVSA